MKFAANILLFLFITFLSTPTIISVIEKNCDTSYFYNLSEEEQSQKEIKAEFKFEPSFTFAYFETKKSELIDSENFLKHDNIASAIFIPPPEQI